ncbi:FAD-binding oxidoreductase [Desulfolutivibrio sulfoxidireducens]|uniref:FAD-binding oxidoreductase n=1 Tax=Desulfolutivibrio sulfoxidireducens TaxID=2773299 RepID=UPI00159DB765|nr:FAD-linked oxidase C-terminal domain-containing protein [Desulfolutivibrio sulfoxidireducens]QLA15667.1 FAD-binding protein [Desulfolutivibrio sulfoxidireducens]QLA19273.1 FAD-binding protein [Desulfolutivibrio sulfoxidireducens]
MSAATPYVPIDAALSAELGRRFGPAFSRRGADLDVAAKDASGLTRHPEAVLTPRGVEEIQAILRLARRHGFPVTPRGAGTGLAGGALAAHGGVVLDLSAMNRILAMDAANMVAVVEPGVVTMTIRDAARKAGLFYPPDPASLDKSTIGGNAATNAGGPACVKYGVTRDYVLGLEAVLPSGEVLAAGTATRKGVVGYDLTKLLVGSEGTLGVITKLILKLIPHPRATRTALALFPDPERAVAAVGAVMTSGITPSCVELMDHRCLALVAADLPFPPPGGRASLLLIETDGDEAAAASDMAHVVAVCRKMAAREVLPAGDEAARERLWLARRSISLRVHESAALYVSEDVAVPLARIPELLVAVEKLERDHGLAVYAFGHAGDGNIHLNLTADRIEADTAGRMAALVTRVLETVLDLGGTISGEHGLGLAKRRFAPMELSKESLALQRGIKGLFDPGLILNPGKIFP